MQLQLKLHTRKLRVIYSINIGGDFLCIQIEYVFLNLNWILYHKINANVTLTTESALYGESFDEVNKNNRITFGSFLAIKNEVGFFI